MERLKRLNWILIAGILFSLAAWATLIDYARAEQPDSTFAERFNGKVQCPNPGETCKVLVLTPQEEKLLMQPNGILDTAAQARSLDLGQFVVYLKTRIGAAPQGEVKPTTAPENKSPAPVDNK